MLLTDGHSTERPPLFAGQHFSYWKMRMELFIGAKEADCWHIIMEGDLIVPPPNPNDIRHENERKRTISLNTKARHYLVCALAGNEFNRVSTCKTAKEMWDRLALIYDGTEQVKESKVNALVTQYEAFKMKKDESINQMFDRLTEITNAMESLGKTISNSELVRKILRSLPKTWEAKK
ncbi:hypothetical protein MLD38_037426 [Melastoma candidum]|uniref:Uncharacterized protein n=1 Tax=Melastoma candidum TaxID=119954 RepID=A0ACB9LNA3_9MYRT|nr:hypothetical protein MLD38_037426 [Melastoma candidum]